jgi:hypothetical protein
MKGVIFNLLEEFIIEIADEDTYEEILDGVTLVTREPFVGPGTYPDEDLVALVTKTVERLGMPAPAALRAFGKWIFPKLAAMVPPELTDFDHPKEFLKTVDRIIHVEVQKLYEHAAPPKFYYEDPGPDSLIMRYHSERKMYDLMDGLLEGVAEHYKVPIQYERAETEWNGKQVCEYQLTFTSTG